MHPYTINKHGACAFEIRHKLWATGRLVPGLFCKDHNCLIDWIRNHQRDLLIRDLNIPVVEWYPTKRQQKRIKYKEQHRAKNTTI
jgi:hypothetical protein